MFDQYLKRTKAFPGHSLKEMDNDDNGIQDQWNKSSISQNFLKNLTHMWQSGTHVKTFYDKDSCNASEIFNGFTDLTFLASATVTL